MERFCVPCASRAAINHCQPAPLVAAGTTTVVTGVDDLFKWPGMNAAAATTCGVTDPNDKLYDCNCWKKSLTSSFSGVCTETVASNMLHSQCQQTHDADMIKFQHLASIERNHACRLEQGVRPHGPLC